MKRNSAESIEGWGTAQLRRQSGKNSSSDELFSAATFTSKDQIRKLAHESSSLTSETFSPEFFLASVEERSWIPRVTVVKRGNRLAGMVYAKERKVAGLATGLLYVDTALGGVAAVNPSFNAPVFETAITNLLRKQGARGARLSVPVHGNEIATLCDLSARQNLDFASQDSQNHSVLRLPFTYDLFLERLGSQTRRNFRYYRRRFENAGGEYVDSLTPEELRQACFDLKRRSRIECRDAAIERALRMLSATERPLMVGLRDKDGQWMSVIAGWREGDRIVIFLQINRDAEYPKLSLSLVLRAYLVESLIAQGAREILFWAGTSGALARYAEDLPTAFVYLDRRTLSWRALRRLICWLGRVAPPKLRPLTYWVYPARICPAGETAGKPASIDQPAAAFANF